MLKKLKFRFICVTMTITALLLTVILGMIIGFTENSLRDQSIRMMQSVAAVPVRRDAPEHIPRRDPGMPINLPHFTVKRAPDGTFTVIGGYEYGDLTDDEYIRSLMEAADASGEPMGTLYDRSLRYLKVSSPMSEHTVFADISSEIAAVSSLTTTCILIGVAALAVFFVLAMLLARWMTRPVETAWQQQRRFVADASHELKTPLTVIMTNAELIGSSDDPYVKSRSADGVLTAAKRMRVLIEDLLTLARLDDGSAKADFADADLSDITENSLLSFEALFFERSIELTSEICGDIHVHGSASQLRQVTDILFDNARKYTPVGGSVNVALRRVGRSECVLTVENSGEEIPKEELCNIFKRFYRVDKARSDTHSYGLGLPIADSIVSSHGGRITAESENGINRFCVHLRTG